MLWGIATNRLFTSSIVTTVANPQSFTSTAGGNRGSVTATCNAVKGFSFKESHGVCLCTDDGVLFADSAARQALVIHCYFSTARNFS